MAMVQVKVVRDFQGSGEYGSRAKGEKFDYNMDSDPGGLKKLGLVEPVDAEPAPKAVK